MKCRHTDGSVRLWHCSSGKLFLSILVYTDIMYLHSAVVLQPFFTLHTNTYFKMKYQPSTVNLKSPPSREASSVLRDARRVPPSRPPPPSKPPPRSLKSQLSQPTSTHSTTEAAENKVSNSMSHPQLSVSLPEVETETQDQRTSNTPSPATGQLRPESQELTDGMYT